MWQEIQCLEIQIARRGQRRRPANQAWGRTSYKESSRMVADLLQNWISERLYSETSQTVLAVMPLRLGWWHTDLTSGRRSPVPRW
jgi:hypothetical protein